MAVSGGGDMTGEQSTGADGRDLRSRVRKFATDGLTRRTFLVLGGTAAAGAIVESAMGNAADLIDGDVNGTILPGFPSYIATLRRPEDQCVLTLAFYNLRPRYSRTDPVLEVIDDEAPSYFAVAFGALDASAPQHVVEEAFPLTGSELTTQPNAPTPPPTSKAIAPPPIDARIAGTSRLVFHVPNSAVAPAADNPIVLDADHLLNWVALRLSVVRNALPPVSYGQMLLDPPNGGVGPPVPPAPTQTAIELPYGIVLSPPAVPVYGDVVREFTPTTVFVNATQPVQHGAWTELWHTRLAARVLRTIGQLSAPAIDETSREFRTVRGIWCTDDAFAADLEANAVEPSPNPARPPFKTSALRYADRYDIVRLSGDFTPSTGFNGGPGGGPFNRTGTNDRGKAVTTPFVPQPAAVDNLMLSSLGGWLDCNAHWDLPHKSGSGVYNSSLLSWRHRTVQGRDCYVRVVRKGLDRKSVV